LAALLIETKISDHPLPRGLPHTRAFFIAASKPLQHHVAQPVELPARNDNAIRAIGVDLGGRRSINKKTKVTRCPNL
jgi:hypothetical protein